MEIRAALYCRVSTHEQAASIQNQQEELSRYAAHRKWAVFQTYVDEGVSGAKDRRPALDRLMTDARKRRFDIVAVWKFDRFARSAQHLLNALAEFKDLGIDFCSLQDAVDTTTAYGKAMFTIIGAMAELERELIRQRVVHGLQKARERGAAIGRPKADFDRAIAQALLSEGHSYSAIGKRLGVSRMTVARAIAQNPCRNPGAALVEASV